MISMQKRGWNPDITLIEGDVHKNFLREAYRFAWENSDDPVTKTGAIIVDPSLEEVLAYGSNHIPKGVVFTEKKLVEDRKWKLDHMIHAEPAVIFAAARSGKSTYGTVMYMPWVPCTPCAKAIIDSGVRTLIGHKQMIMKTTERWWESTDYALDLLSQAGVEKYMVDGEIGGVSALFNGEEWFP